MGALLSRSRSEELNDLKYGTNETVQVFLMDWLMEVSRFAVATSMGIFRAKCPMSESTYIIKEAFKYKLSHGIGKLKDRSI